MAITYNVYRSPAVNAPIDYSAPVGTTAALTFTTAALAHPGTWTFGVRAVDSVSGLEDQNIDAVVTITLDAAGHDITNRPPAPSSLRALARAGGTIRVEWTPPPVAVPTTPTGFHVYIQTGSLTYSTPAATVAWSAMLAGSFQVDVPGFTGGTAYNVGVRAFNAVAEETNTNTVTVTAITAGPTAVTGLVGVATSKGA